MNIWRNFANKESNNTYIYNLYFGYFGKTFLGICLLYLFRSYTGIKLLFICFNEELSFSLNVITRICTWTDQYLEHVGINFENC